MLPARHRLRRAADFTAVVRGPGSARAGGRLMVVHAVWSLGPSSGSAPSDLPPRVGFVVSKAVGGAVVRNRTKRVLRHLVAARLDGIPGGYDVVVRATPAAAGASTTELACELDAALSRALSRVASRAGSRSATRVGRELRR